MSMKVCLCLLLTASQPALRAAAADTGLCKQDLEQFDKLREALAHGVAQAVHQNRISVAEGVADPIDAMIYACDGLEWELIDVCHADRNHNPKRFPTMIAEYYMGGIVAGKTLRGVHCMSGTLCWVRKRRLPGRAGSSHTSHQCKVADMDARPKRRAVLFIWSSACQMAWLFR